MGISAQGRALGGLKDNDLLKECLEEIDYLTKQVALLRESHLKTDAQLTTLAQNLTDVSVRGQKQFEGLKSGLYMVVKKRKKATLITSNPQRPKKGEANPVVVVKKQKQMKALASMRPEEVPGYVLCWVLDSFGQNTGLHKNSAITQMLKYGVRDRQRAWGAILGLSQTHSTAPSVHYDSKTKKVSLTSKGRERLR